MVVGGVGALLGAAWLYRLIETGLGLPRIVDVSTPEWLTADALPTLTVIVPARNEERDVEACLRSLLEADYPDIQVIAVNDRSSDRTGDIMDRLAATSDGKLKTLHIADLPPGWMGKVHAMWRGSEIATSDLLLFTDADVFFAPTALRRAVSYLQSRSIDHLVLFPTMLYRTWGERMVISFFNVTLGFAHRPWKVSDPKAHDHIGVGAFNLVRRQAYEAVGTFKAIPSEVIDDLRLGKMIKQRFRQDVVLGPGLVTIHWATGAMGVVRALSKNAFALLRFNWFLVLGGMMGIAFATLFPLIGVVFAAGWAKAGFAVALASMAGIYFQVGRVTGISGAYFLLHPLGAVLSIYALLRSAWVTSRKGVVWRGTAYPLTQFKKGS